MQSQIISVKHYKFYIFLAFLSFILYSWVFFSNWLIGRDEGQFLLFAKLISEGQLIYVDINTNRSPIPFYIMAFFMWLSNDNLHFVRLLVPLFNFLTAVIIYHIGYEHWNITVGKISSFFYVIGSIMPLFEEIYLMTEPFELFFGTLAIYFYLAFKKSEKNLNLFISGIFVGLSFLSKQYGLLFFTVIFVYESLILVYSSGSNNRISFLKVHALIFSGFLLPILSFLGLFFINGNLDAVINLYFGETASQSSSLIRLPNFATFLHILIGFCVVYVFALFFTWRTLLDFVDLRVIKVEHLLLIWAFVFSLLMLISTSGPYFFHTLPPSVLMAAIVIESRLGLSFSLPKEYFGSIKKKIHFNNLITLLLIVSLSTNFWAIYSIDDRMTLDDQKKIADYVEENTSTNETILVYHAGPQFYYLSDRAPPFEYRSVEPSADEEWLEEVIERIKENEMRFLIVYEGMLNPDERIDTKYPETAMFKFFLRSNFVLINDEFRYNIYYRDYGDEWV